MNNQIDLVRLGTLPNTRQSGELELKLRCWIRYARAVKSELTRKSGLTLRQRLRAWRLGFTAHSWQIYDLDENDPSLYLPDLRATRKMYRINGFFHPVISNKLILSHLLDAQGVPHPDVVSQVVGGQLLVEGAPHEPDTVRALMQTLERYPRQVFRPTSAGNGQGVFFLNLVDGELQLNGEKVSGPEIGALFVRLDRYLSTEFKDQASYSSEIYPGSTNTLRIVTLWDEESASALVAAAIHRFGTQRSGLVDNFHSGRGGVCAGIDLDTSKLGKAVMQAPENRMVRVSRHPDTGARIEGVTVPLLAECMDVLVKVAERFPSCPWIGWDVVITEDGFSILEANTLPNFAVSQTLSPFLEDPRKRRIFQRWGLAP